MTEKAHDRIQTLEQGNIYFFYRPKVEEESPGKRADIQRLYMILGPEKAERFRLTVIGRKKLPDPSRSGRGRYWGFVDHAAPGKGKRTFGGGVPAVASRPFGIPGEAVAGRKMEVAENAFRRPRERIHGHAYGLPGD